MSCEQMDKLPIRTNVLEKIKIFRRIMSLKTKISLKNFFIFNSTYCSREGEVKQPNTLIEFNNKF